MRSKLRAMKRRELLIAMSAVSAMSVLPLGLKAQGALRVVSITDSISLITGAGANVVVAEGPDSVVVIDGGLREHANELLAEINRITDSKPISVLFNTNWRPEHTGLNYLLGGSDTRIVAHENTRLWQTADIEVDWEGRSYQPMPEEAQANDTFYKTGSMMLGAETINYGYELQAHTDGDIYIHFVDADVLVVSDMLSVDAYPVIDFRTGGWLGGLRNASADVLEKSGDNTKIIASYGEVYGKAELQAQYDMLVQAYELVEDSFRSGWSLEELKESRPGDVLGSQWGDPDLFLTQSYSGIWYHVPGRAVRNVI